MQLSQVFMSQPALRRCLLVLSAACALAGSAARAQNLDEGKSAPRLFADSCATCHRGAPGLAKGRSRSQLFQFLQEHYATSANTAAELATYLAAVDTRRGRRPLANAGPSAPATTRRSAVRPPKPVSSTPTN